MKLFGNRNTVDTMSYIIMQKVAPLQIYYAQKRNEMHFVVVTLPEADDPQAHNLVWISRLMMPQTLKRV